MFQNIMGAISTYAIPLILLLIPLYGYIKKVKVYEAFTEGAKEGFYTAVRIIPYLVAMLVAIGIFRKSGAMDILNGILRPITNLIGMPSEVLPMALMKPLSGGGASGIMNDLFTTYGPDSLIGRTASIMNGSTETTFYVLAVYFGSVAIKKTRHAVLAGLIADTVGIITAVIVARIMFA
ncbi:spore maturation protein [Anaeromicrobium sediminis]|uniref:Spore maturation protein n=1 Tax=Anaeromicrobium sediminis TaxID=1478221 RepID=A0A267MI95_9FIRM|nr:spore maturation protein [Anaeromicrobium sediminis]PAB59301.1 spore maturation protein [Anaeromicrobium sediminis]